MIYLLLYPLADRFSALNVLRYPTTRTIFAGITALLIGWLLGPAMIRALRLRQHGQSNVREDTPEQHQKKAGTPTMGGALILFAFGLAVLLFGNLTNKLVLSTMLVTLGYGAIGFMDDWLKLTRKNSKGLAGRKKIFWQVVIFVAAIGLFHTHWNGWVPTLELDTRLAMPFVPIRSFYPDFGWLYVPLAFFVVLGTSNAVNLTDGLDGLAIGPSIVSALCFGILSYAAGAVLAGFNVANYLYIPHVPGAAELPVVCAAFAGAGLAFLWFNSFPASVFMGDVGALAIGGGLGMMAVLTKNEVGSAILHGVFLAEALSVMLQVASFKWTGKRIFKMAPVHHHFELEGWSEPKIIVRFWIVSALLALITIAGALKLR